MTCPLTHGRDSTYTTGGEDLPVKTPKCRIAEPVYIPFLQVSTRFQLRTDINDTAYKGIDTLHTDPGIQFCLVYHLQGV